MQNIRCDMNYLYSIEYCISFRPQLYPNIEFWMGGLYYPPDIIYL